MLALGSATAPEALQRLRILCDGIDAPIAIAVARDGRAYVANGDTGCDGCLRTSQGGVVVFDPGSSKSREISGNGTMLTDTSGNYYVSSGGNGIDSGNFVLEFDRTGAQIRTIAIDGSGRPGGIALDGDGTLYVAFQRDDGSGAFVNAYRPGATRPFRTFATPCSDGRILATGAHDLYASSSGHGTVVCAYALAGGTLVRALPGDGWLNAMAFDRSGNLYAALTSGDRFGIAVYDARGTRVRTIATGAPPSALAFSASGDLYVATQKSSIDVFAAPDMTRAFTLLATGAGLAVDPARQELYAGQNGAVYVYRIPQHATDLHGTFAATGLPYAAPRVLPTINPEPQDRHAVAAARRDGAAWLLDVAATGAPPPAGYPIAVTVLHPDGTRTPYPSSVTATDVSAYATAPDDSLWFASQAPSFAARVALDGNVTTFPLPRDAGVVALAAGDDGDVWLAENGSNAIGRLGSDGKLAHFALPTKNRPIVQMAAASGGGAWFLMGPQPRTIGRIAADGTISLLHAAGNPTSVVRAADGTVWFSQTGPAAIGSIDAAGAIVRHPVENCTIQPLGILSIYGGSVWFWDQHGWLRRMSLDGRLDETVVATLPFVTSAPGDIFDLTVNVSTTPAGRVWYSWNAVQGMDLGG